MRFEYHLLAARLEAGYYYVASAYGRGTCAKYAVVAGTDVFKVPFFDLMATRSSFSCLELYKAENRIT